MNGTRRLAYTTLLAAMLPVFTGTQVAAQTRQAAVPITYKNISLIDTLPHTGVVVKRVAAVPYDPNTPPGAAPAHVEFQFSPYYSTLFTKADVLPPVVAVYATTPFATYHFDTTLRSLQTLLKTHTNLKKIAQLPFLPVLEGARVIHAREAYLSFRGGAGIRYLTYLSEDVSPVTANRMLYTFQGVTTNGKYYVYATFPVHIAFLPGAIPSTFDYNTFSRNFTSYLATLVRKLNGPDGATALTPSPTQLDAVVESLTVR